MKKRFIIAMLLLCSLLCACAKENTSAPASSTSERTIPESSTPDPPTSEGSTLTGSENYYETNHFSSYEELKSFVVTEAPKVQSSNSARFPDNYKAALSQMITKGIPIPCKGGDPIHLQNQNKSNETNRISLLPRLSFSAPGFFYYTTSNNEQIWIELSLEQDISSTFTDEDSGSEIVCALNPNANNLHNAEERTDYYSYIGERVISTSNGDKNALYKMGTDGRERYTFMQNGYVVELYAKPGALTDEWFEDFSIELMPVSDAATSENGQFSADSTQAVQQSTQLSLNKYSIEVDTARTSTKTFSAMLSSADEIISRYNTIQIENNPSIATYLRWSDNTMDCVSIKDNVITISTANPETTEADKQSKSNDESKIKYLILLSFITREYGDSLRYIESSYDPNRNFNAMPAILMCPDYKALGYDTADDYWEAYDNGKHHLENTPYYISLRDAYIRQLYSPSLDNIFETCSESDTI